MQNDPKYSEKSGFDNQPESYLRDIRQSVTHSIPRVLGWIMLVLVINISVNHPDFRGQGQSRGQHKTAVPNSEVESIYELIAEGLFDENIPDTEDSDTESLSKTFDLQIAAVNEMIVTPHTPIEHRIAYLFIFPIIHLERSGPPPKLV